MQNYKLIIAIILIVFIIIGFTFVVSKKMLNNDIEPENIDFTITGIISKMDEYQLTLISENKEYIVNYNSSLDMNNFAIGKKIKVTYSLREDSDPPILYAKNIEIID